MPTVSKAQVALARGEVKRAEVAARRAITALSADGLTGSKAMYLAESTLGQVFEVEHRWDELCDLQEQMVQELAASRGPGEAWTVAVKAQLMKSLVRAGRSTEALTMVDDILALQERLFGHDSKEYTETAAWRGRALLDGGLHEEAADSYAEAVDMYERLYGENHKGTCRLISSWADSLSRVGADRYDSSIEQYQRSLSIQDRNGFAVLDVPRIRRALGQMLSYRQRYAEAVLVLEPLFRDVREGGELTEYDLACLQWYVGALEEVGRLDDAARLAQMEVEEQEGRHGRDAPAAKAATLRLVRIRAGRSSL
jgi:tetratricopeptide (TPR) repeat protein